MNAAAINTQMKLCEMKGGSAARIRAYASRETMVLRMRALGQYEQQLDKILEDKADQLWLNAFITKHGYNPYYMDTDELRAEQPAVKAVEKLLKEKGE